MEELGPDQPVHYISFTLDPEDTSFGGAVTAADGTYTVRGMDVLRTPDERFANLPVKETMEILPDEVRANPDLYERIGIAEETFPAMVLMRALGLGGSCSQMICLMPA